MADTAVTDLDVLAASLDHLARRFCEDEADARPPNGAADGREATRDTSSVVAKATIPPAALAA
jgi:hypothetical protein